MTAPRRPRSGQALLHAVGRARALARGSEIGLVALGVAAGCAAGAAVAAMSLATQALREALYQLEPGARLSASHDLSPLHALLAPALGGLVLGLLGFVATRWGGGRRRAAIDPIEANALHGGRMSLRDSAEVSAQTVISNGCGASVGLEAGYTQIASALASRLGRAFDLRRADLRALVGCGSAAAIAAAFDAPLAGAFYAFELIIGAYSIATLAPVVAASLCGSVVARALAPHAPLAAIERASDLTTSSIGSADILPCLCLGLVCAGLGILVMRGVTLVEAGIRASGLPAFAAPALGGLCVGALALAVSPQVLSGGHGAIHLHLAADAPAMGAGALALLFAAKATASAISIGAGFRGGLFFASLFLGALAGKLFAVLAPEALPGIAAFGLTPLAYGVIGMSALAAAIVGGPLTMAFLTLELTGSLPLTGLSLAAVIAASLTVRAAFGYSFATWRFHLRGESIRGAHDIGWIRSLTVGALMRRDVATTPADTPFAAFLRAHPLGSSSRVVLTDAEGRYAGIVTTADAHAAERDSAGREPRLADLARHAGDALTTEMSAKDAAALFDRTASEALAVVDHPGAGRVIGLLTETHTLKRYAEELDRQRRAIVGEGDGR